MDTLYKMPVRDRKYYISRHNEITEGSNTKHKHHESTLNGEMINKYTDIEQQNLLNLSNS
jgi:hypothetical protein